MKRFLAIFVAILAISSVAFAQAPTLPDYQKDGKLEATFTCDGGKTTQKVYYHNDWGVRESRTSAGDVFVEFRKQGQDKYFMQLAGWTKMKNITHEEFDKVLAQKSKAVYNGLHGESTDCKKQ